MSAALSLPITVDALGRLNLTSVDSHRVSDQIVLLLGTRPGDRTNRPTYGVDLAQFLFRGITDSDVDLIKQLVRQAVTRWIEHVHVVSVDVDGSTRDGLVQVAVGYTITYGVGAGSAVHRAVVYPGGISG